MRKPRLGKRGFWDSGFDSIEELAENSEEGRCRK